MTMGINEGYTYFIMLTQYQYSCVSSGIFMTPLNKSNNFVTAIVLVCTKLSK